MINGDGGDIGADFLSGGIVKFNLVISIIALIERGGYLYIPNNLRN